MPLKQVDGAPTGWIRLLRMRPLYKQVRAPHASTTILTPQSGILIALPAAPRRPDLAELVARNLRVVALERRSPCSIALYGRPGARRPFRSSFARRRLEKG